MQSKELDTIRRLKDALSSLLAATYHYGYGYSDDQSDAFWEGYAELAAEEGLSSDDVRARTWDAAKQVLIGVETTPQEPYLVTLACVPASVLNNKFSTAATIQAWHAGAKVEPYGLPLNDGKSVAVRLDGTAAFSSVEASEITDHLDWSRVPAMPSYQGITGAGYDAGYAAACGYHD